MRRTILPLPIRRPPFRHFPLLIASLALAVGMEPGRVRAEDQTKKQEPPATSKIIRIAPSRITFGQDIDVEFNELPKEWLEGGKLNSSKLALYLNGQEVNGLRPTWSGHKELSFRLESNKDSSESWSRIFSRPSWEPLKLRVGIGPAGSGAAQAIRAEDMLLEIVVIHRLRFWICFVGLIGFLSLFLELARRSTIIREPAEPHVPTRFRQFSLGRTQMAVWYFLVLAAFLFTWAIKADYPTIPDQILGLIGIASGTALGAAVIDNIKTKPNADTARVDLEAQQAALLKEIEQAEREVSQAREASKNAPPDPPRTKKALGEDMEQAKRNLNFKENESRTVLERIETEVKQLEDACKEAEAEFQSAPEEPATEKTALQQTMDTAKGGLQAKKKEREDTQSRVSKDILRLKDEVSRTTNAFTAAPADPEKPKKDLDEDLEKKSLKLADMRITLTKIQHQLGGSENFFVDILTDENGISFHRFQIVVWTLVLAVLFVNGVWQELKMPNFDSTLLALMGISSGTYLGFKIPEKTTRA